MRISTAMLHRQAADQISQLNQETARTQQLIASGRAFLSPSDDPLAAAGIARIEQDRALRAQYLENTEVAQTHLGLEDTTLGQVLDVLQRVRELTLQAGDPALTRDDRRFLAAELTARKDELLSLANTQDARGNYLFAGYQSQQAPFVVAASGAIEFSGDQGTRAIAIDRNAQVELGNSGQTLFEAIGARSTTPWVHPSTAADASLSAVVADQAAFDAFAPDNVQLQYRIDSQGQLLVTASRTSDGRIIDGVEDVPASAVVALPSIGLDLTTSGRVGHGDSFRIDSSPHQSVMQTLNLIAQDLQTGHTDDAPGRDRLRRLIDDTLVNLDNGMNRLLSAQAGIGAEQNRIDSTQNLHRDVDLQAQQTLSTLSDLDFAKAVSELNLQSILLEAAQQSFVRINRLSLFNSL